MPYSLNQLADVRKNCSNGVQRPLGAKGRKTLLEVKPEIECCICFVSTISQTPCLHALCEFCWGVLASYRKLTCPLCRRELPPPPEDGSEGLEDDGQEVEVPERPPSPRSRFLSSVGGKRGWKDAARSLPTLPTIQRLSRDGSASALLSVNTSGLHTSNISPAGSVSTPTSPAHALQRSVSTPTSPVHGSQNMSASQLSSSESSSIPQSPRSPVHLLSHSAVHSPLSPPPLSLALRQQRQLRQRQQPQQRGRTLRIPGLLARIARMDNSEIPRFTQHVVWLQAESFVSVADANVLCRAIRRRIADVFSQLSISSVNQGGDLLALLMDHTRSCPALGGDTPRRALEARLSYFVYHPLDGDDHDAVELETFAKCYKEAGALVERGLIAPRVVDVTVTHILRWIQRAPIACIYKHARLVQSLSETLPELGRLLSSRIQRLTLHRFDPLQLMGYVLVILDFREHGLALLDSNLESKLLHQLSVGVSDWPSSRLTAELGPQGALRMLCHNSAMIKQAVAETLLKRVLSGVSKIANSLKQDTDLERMKQELIEWGQLVHMGGAAGVLGLSYAERGKIIDTLSDCTARCMRSTALRSHVGEFEKAQWAIAVLTAGPVLSNNETN